VNKTYLFIAVVLLVTVGSVVFFANEKKTNPPTQETVIIEPSQAPAPTSSSLMYNDKKEMKTAIIKTSKGDIELSLFEQEAPNTVSNFVKKGGEDYYKNLNFHRVEDWVIQGGDPDGNGTGGGKMATELNDKPFVIGSLGVARGGDIKLSNDSQFFITKTDASWLNGQYTNFGIVTNGMDVVNKIEIGDQILGITIK